MFELEIYTENYSEIRNIHSSNDDFSLETSVIKNDENYEILFSKIRIFKLESTNLNITEKSEIYRFLPIRRSTVIYVYSIPLEMKIADFIEFLGSHSKNILYSRFLYQKSQNKDVYSFSAILYFIDLNSVDNFYHDFNTKMFPNDRFECLYLLFPTKLTYFTILDSSIDSLKFKIEERSELTTCPLCIEKIDVSISGVSTILNRTKDASIERWKDFYLSCKICKSLKNHEKLRCEEVNCPKISLWCCLICGYIGCDRYQNCHAVQHFQTSNHRFSIEMETERIWDYLGDIYVHRFVNFDRKNQENSIHLDSYLNENSDQTNIKEFLRRIDNITVEYENMFATQLEDQKVFYSKELEKIKENSELRKKNLEKNILKLKEVKSKVEEKKKAVKENKRKIKEFEKKIRDLKEKKELNERLALDVESDLNKFSINCFETDEEKELNKKYLRLTQLKEEKMKSLEELYMKFNN